MAIRSYSSDFNFVLIFDNDKIFFKDLDQFENKTYRVETDEAEQLQRTTRLSIADAAALLGKIEQIRLCSSKAKHVKPQKIDSEKLNQTLAILLLQEDWKELFMKFDGMKYHQIINLCETETPVTYWNRL